MISSKLTASAGFRRNSPLGFVLDVINAAGSLEDIALPHFGLYALKGDRAGTWAVKVNKNWRLTFTFAGGDASDVNFEDYH